MDSKEYIDSGILELYVAGALSEKENEAVHAMMLQHPAITQEVLSIEAAIIGLTAATAHKDNSAVFEAIKKELNLTDTNDDTPVVPLQQKPPIFMYIGWAAAIVLAVGLVFSVLKTDALEYELDLVNSQKKALQEEVYETNNNLTAANELLEVLRTKDIISVPLGGQQVSPESYAKVYWDQKSNRVYLDLQGLPDPPAGKVYQIWSLKLDPLTPTSLGTIANFSDDKDKVFDLENANQSEAFGITLEPAGGSESPTLEQLYTLGVVNNSAP